MFTVNAARLTRLLVGIVTLVMVAHVALRLYPADFFGDVTLRDFFDLDREESFPTWLSTFLFLLCGVTLAAIAAVQRSRGAPYLRHWSSLAALFLAASVDEVAAFHEHLSEPLRDLFHLDGFLYFAWVIPAGLFMILLAVIYLRFFLDLPAALRRALLVAALLFLGGALGVEIFDGNIAAHVGQESLTYQLTTTLEEVLELAGEIVLLHALLGYLRSLTSGFTIEIS